jgi:DNA-binding winged helix-turn-helix (wHTH) protein/Tfp pilus assembly protein PilF
VARYRFGVFEVDPAASLLLRAGRRVPLAPQPFRALVLLLDRAGTVVTRDELKPVLWGESTFVEFDQGVNFTIRQVRQALGDDARSPRFLETLPRRGYRFLGPVERIEDAAAGPPRTKTAAVSPPARPRWTGPLARAAAVLLLALVHEPASRLADRHPSPPAREAFRRGQEMADRGERRRSLAAFREAVARDPAYAEAHYAIASIYVDLAEQGELAPAHAFPIARAEAERALALEDVAATRLVLGAERFQYAWDLPAAERHYARALELAPSSVSALVARSRLLSAAGRHREAIDAIARAEAVTPSCDLVLHESGWVHYRARRWAEAVRKFQQAAELGPPHFMDEASWRRLNRFRIAFVHLQAGQPAAAAADAEELARLGGAKAEWLGSFRTMPPEDVVRRMLRNSLRYYEGLSEQRYVSPVRFAEDHAALGEDDEAIRWLARAARDRAPDLPYSLADPVFDGLRGHPALHEIAGRLRGDEPDRPAIVADAGTPAR